MPLSARTMKKQGRVSLDQLQTGIRAHVAAIQGGRSLRSRLATFGFVPGAEVEVWRNAGTGPIIVQVHGARVALGRGEAARIFVEVDNGNQHNADDGHVFSLSD